MYWTPPPQTLTPHRRTALASTSSEQLTRKIDACKRQLRTIENQLLILKSKPDFNYRSEACKSEALRLLRDKKMYADGLNQLQQMLDSLRRAQMGQMLQETMMSTAEQLRPFANTDDGRVRQALDTFEDAGVLSDQFHDDTSASMQVANAGLMSNTTKITASDQAILDEWLAVEHFPSTPTDQPENETLEMVAV